MREHVITCIDTVLRKHPDCGIILTGDFNQFKDNFLICHYRLVQVVNVLTRGLAILDKIWTNLGELYSPPTSISGLGSSDHNMILLKVSDSVVHSNGNVTRVTIKSMGFKEKANFATALSVVRWEPLYMLQTCEEMYIYYKTIISELMERCFPNKSATRHTGNKPWTTDQFRLLIRKRQRAYYERCHGDI